LTVPVAAAAAAITRAADLPDRWYDDATVSAFCVPGNERGLVGAFVPKIKKKNVRSH